MKIRDASRVSALITVFAGLMIAWALPLVLIGFFTDLRFIALGCILLVASIVVLLLARKTELKSTISRVIVTIYLITVFVGCAAGVFASFRESIPGAVMFGCIGAIALASFVALNGNWRSTVDEMDDDVNQNSVEL